MNRVAYRPSAITTSLMRLYQPAALSLSDLLVHAYTGIAANLPHPIANKKMREIRE